jgi:hypothetical protein
VAYKGRNRNATDDQKAGTTQNYEVRIWMCQKGGSELPMKNQKRLTVNDVVKKSVSEPRPGNSECSVTRGCLSGRESVKSARWSRPHSTRSICRQCDEDQTTSRRVLSHAQSEMLTPPTCYERGANENWATQQRFVQSYSQISNRPSGCIQDNIGTGSVDKLDQSADQQSITRVKFW